jgi:tetratricopeptide (TPR) repeat protein
VPELVTPFSNMVMEARFENTRALWLGLLFAVTAVVLSAPSLLVAKDRDLPAPVAKQEEPSGLEKLYRERAASNPKDLVALDGMAILESRRGDYAGAIAAYRSALEIAPEDRDAQVGLARTLAWSGQYEAALEGYRRILQERPDDTDALEGLGLAYAWSRRASAALPIFQDLAKQYPADTDYAVELARVETNLNRYADARQTLTAVLTRDPRNHDARMQFAYLDLHEGRQADALRRFNHLIAENPADSEALKGNARIAYYRGDLQYAHDLTAGLVADNPRDVDAILLLANLERALHRTRNARALLATATGLDAHNQEARELSESLARESRITLHTSASMAREIGSGESSGSEDLRMFGYETTWGFSGLPRSDSFITLNYLPSSSPSGSIQGAVGPAEILYRQTTYLTSRLTLRGGAGLARFGPGELFSVPNQQQAVPSAGARAIGFVNLSYAVRKKLTVDLSAGRSAPAYTPTAVKLGVVEDRAAAALEYHPSSRTEFRVEGFIANNLTIPYDHVLTSNGLTQAVIHEADHNQARGGSITFSRNLVRKRWGAFDLGYSGLVYGFEAGKPSMGFFTPGFYQRHYVTPHASGKLHGPLGYDLLAGAGVQQVEHGSSLTRAMLISPALTLRASSRLVLTLGYTHYDSSQSLGTLRGNAVRLSTDWKF